MADTPVTPMAITIEKIKEALVLQLVGGVKKERKDGMITRGDMHILLIGDPGAGKSQLLKNLCVLSGLFGKKQCASNQQHFTGTPSIL